MIGGIVLIVVAVAVWFYLRSLGPKAPAGSSPALRSPTTAQPAKRGPKAPTVMRILYGTQTGTAQGFAKTMLREATRNKVAAEMCDLEEYNTREMCDEKVVVFLVATYGEGEPPDTMKNFYDWLMTEATSDDVRGVKYAVFGLGDRQYKHFGAMGEHIDDKMEQLGAERIVGLAIGDAGQNLEEEYDAWRENMWPLVGTALGMNLSADREEPVEPELTLQWCDDDMKGDTPFVPAAPMIEPTPAQPVYATVVANEELLKGKATADRCTRRIELSFEGASMSYQAGDHLGVLPCNTDDLVREYLDVLGATADANRVVAMTQPPRNRNTLPSRQPLRIALKWFIDLAGAPKKNTLRAFAHFCEDQKEKEEFLAILRTNDAAIARYHDLQAKARNTLGFLRHFKSCKVPVAQFLEFMPRLAPRYFSISSDQLQRPTSVVITVALVHNGVCTSMLCAAETGSKVPVYVRKSTFHLPLRDKQRPLIMIGPGTGVAPLVGFCERREAWQKKGQQLGDAMLFFGCRSKAEDFIHQEYLEKSEQAGVLSVLDVAFSREQKEKVYVQHRIAARAAEVWGLLSAGANIYICGDAKHMAKDVERTLVDKVLVGAGGMPMEQAVGHLDDLLAKGRYHKDVWSA